MKTALPLLIALVALLSLSSCQQKIGVKKGEEYFIHVTGLKNPYLGKLYKVRGGYKLVPTGSPESYATDEIFIPYHAVTSFYEPKKR